MNKTFISAGIFLAALSVALGAFGAHGLKQFAPAESIQTFQTGVQYQMYHALALILAGILHEKFSASLARLAAKFFIAGIILFSGSLYLLVLLKATDTVGLSKIGLITPFGGLSFITGWIILLLAVQKKNN